MMRAKDVMKKNVVSIKENDSVREAVSVLMKNHISGMPVVDEDNHPVGMLTERDLVTRDKGINISSYMEFVASILFIDGQMQESGFLESMCRGTAHEIMSAPVYSVHLEATVEEIASLMINRRINRIPVIDDENRLVGIIGRTDLLPALIHR